MERTARGPEHPQHPGFFQIPEFPHMFVNERGSAINDPTWGGLAPLNPDSIAAFDALEASEPISYEEAQLATTETRYRTAGEPSKVRQQIGAVGDTPILKYVYPKKRPTDPDKFGWVVERKKVV